MSDAGWYPDPSDAAKLRWFDGSDWTEHTHDRVPAARTAEAAAAATPASAGMTATPTAIDISTNRAETQVPQRVESDTAPSRPRTNAVNPVRLVLAGAFTGVIMGVVLMGLVAAFSPISTEAGFITAREHHDAPKPSDETFHISGTREDGSAWRIRDMNGYFAVDEARLPLPVELAVADWTDTVVRVSGPDVDVNTQSNSRKTTWIIPFVLVIAMTARHLTSELAASPNRNHLIGAYVLGLLIALPVGWLLHDWVTTGPLSDTIKFR